MRSGCAARTAISSLSSRAESGTCLNSSGSHGMDYIVGAGWFCNEMEETITECDYGVEGGGGWFRGLFSKRLLSFWGRRLLRG